MGKLAVVVPTYWGPVRDYELGKPSPAYDHPSPINSQGTLPRLLKSLARNSGSKFQVHLIVAPTEPELGDIAEARVQGIAARFAGTISVTVIGPRALSGLRAEFGKGGETEFFSLQGYGNVRNLGLMVGLLSGAEAIVLLDDDEVVEPDYLARASAALARAADRAGEAVGVAGPYLDPRGSPFLPEGPAQGNIFLDKARYMNAALKALLAGREAKRTPLAFGGNMVLSRALAREVPFDPLIPRGEDIDYVLSVWLLGFEFYFDPGFSVTHLPPPEPRPSPCEALRRDVARFIYQREKLAWAAARGLSPPVELGPYPGRFLRGDLETEAAAALGRHCSQRKGDPAAEFVCAAREWAGEVGGEYFEVVSRWRSSTRGV